MRWGMAATTWLPVIIPTRSIVSEISLVTTSGSVAEIIAIASSIIIPRVRRIAESASIKIVAIITEMIRPMCSIHIISGLIMVVVTASKSMVSYYFEIYSI